jgi:D-3-phosphoglycerate dehydrogenase
VRGGVVAQFAQGARPAGAALVNCARGGIVDEGALGEALARGHLSGAGIDVYEAEPPPPDHPLLAMPNVFSTPHAAAATREAAWRMSTHAARNILDFLDGRLEASMVYPVPPRA